MPSNPSPSATDEFRFADFLPSHGYFDSHGNLYRQYVERKEVDPLAAEMAAAGLTSTQFRRFFQHCRAIQACLRSGGTKWDRIYPEFAKIDAAAERALHRERDPLPKIFYQFLRANVAAVQTEKDFLEGFLPHFEALLGFFTGHRPKK